MEYQHKKLGHIFYYIVNNIPNIFNPPQADREVQSPRRDRQEDIIIMFNPFAGLQKKIIKKFYDVVF